MKTTKSTRRNRKTTRNSNLATRILLQFIANAITTLHPDNMLYEILNVFKLFQIQDQWISSEGINNICRIEDNNHQRQGLWTNINNKPDSHGEGIDIFIKSIEKEDGLNDHIIDSVHIELHLCSAVTVSQTKLGLF